MSNHALLGKANANPTKAFFVQMLTRDISLDDCLLDLIDNSVDGAWKLSGHNPSRLAADNALGNYRVDIRLAPDTISIRDNCGGISLDNAKRYAFTFGREDDREEYSVGVYGIGMKRAVFKMGRSILVRSTHQGSDGTQSFEVPIDVRRWLRDTRLDWDFDILDAPQLEAPGVEIEVKNLTPLTADRLSDPTYETDLRAMISRDYLVPLMRGLGIYVNGTRVASTGLAFAAGNGFAPMRRTQDRDKVHVELLAGMYAPPRDDLAPSNDKRRDPSGWYIACNGRVVLAADKSELSGWGTGLMPKWHPQYSGFIGVVLFSSDHPLLLPMTTTKRNVDVSSSLYQRTLQDMANVTKEWIRYTGARKANLESAAKAEEQAKPTPLASVAPRQQIALPPLAPGPSYANVNYAVEAERMRNLAAAFGSSSMNYREVGMKSFDFAYSELVEED